MRPDEHECPYPGCTRAVYNEFWGCSQHWFRLPAPLRKEFVNSKKPDAEVQPVKHQMAIERIRNYLAETMVEIAPTPTPTTEQRESTATEDLTGFTAGWTAEGKLCLFWAAEGEYLVLGPDEIKVLRRAVTL